METLLCVQFTSFHVRSLALLFTSELWLDFRVEFGRGSLYGEKNKFSAVKHRIKSLKFSELLCSHIAVRMCCKLAGNVKKNRVYIDIFHVEFFLGQVFPIWMLPK